jgi:hypothetical protein
MVFEKGTEDNQVTNVRLGAQIQKCLNYLLENLSNNTTADPDPL